MDLYKEFDSYLVAVRMNDLNKVIKEHRQEFLHKLDANDQTPFHHACNLGHIEVVKFILSKNVNIEFPSPFNNWRALHWAVGNGYEMVGKLLIENGADKEAKAMKNLRPLHCAAMADHHKAVQVLLALGVDINAVNERNETALQMAQNYQSTETVKVFNKWLSYENVFNFVRQNQLEACKDTFIKERVLVKEKNTQLTVLDIAVNSKAHQCLEFIFLENINEQNIYEGLKATLEAFQIQPESFKSQYRLYRSILFDYKDEFCENATVWNINEGWILTGETYLEICCRYKRMFFIPTVMQMLIEINESWDRAVNIAVANASPVIGEMIKSRKTFVLNRTKAFYNRLHIAIQDNNMKVIKYILENELIDPNKSEPMLGSPLCLALSLGHMDSVQALCEYQIDFNKTNKFNQTPLHIALETKITEDYLKFINIPEFVDHKDCYGFTSLHLAVINKDEKETNILVENGADIFMPLQIQQTSQMDNLFMSAIIPLNDSENPLTLSLKLHRTIFPCMIDKINYQVSDNNNDNHGNSLLHLSTKLLVPSITESLIVKGFPVNSINLNGNTPLHSAFLESTDNCWEMEGFFETVRTLLRYGANINALNKQRLSAFSCAMNTRSRKTLNIILSQCREVIVNSDDIFQMYERQWPDILKIVLDLQDHEFKQKLLCNYIVESQSELIDFIFDISDEKFIESIVEECLSLSAQYDNDCIFDKLLEFNISHPKILLNGETLLTNLILNSDEKFSLKLCRFEQNHQFFEMKNKNSLSPLYLAASRGYLKLFKCLLLEVQNMEEEISGISATDLLMNTILNTCDKQKIGKLEKVMKLIIKQMPPKPSNFSPSFIQSCKNPQLKSKLEVFYTKNRKEIIEDEDKNLCEICIQNKLDCVFECGHPFCKTCSDKVMVCPKCRRPKSKLGKLYLP